MPTSERFCYIVKQWFPNRGPLSLGGHNGLQGDRERSPSLVRLAVLLNRTITVDICFPWKYIYMYNNIYLSLLGINAVGDHHIKQLIGKVWEPLFYSIDTLGNLEVLITLE